ncbi:flagellin [Sandarakinorhabdus limnophila]|uniref:flagellin n=1 Tax=Sandarakinorhabdus limnophila TaxID=210512 RepID=UPI00350E3B80
MQIRKEAAVNKLSSNSTNLQASRSHIQGTDFEQGSTNLAKNQVLSRAAQAILSPSQPVGQAAHAADVVGLEGHLSTIRSRQERRRW